MDNQLKNQSEIKEKTCNQKLHAFDRAIDLISEAAEEFDKVDMAKTGGWLRKWVLMLAEQKRYLAAMQAAERREAEGKPDA